MESSHFNGMHLQLQNFAILSNNTIFKMWASDKKLNARPFKYL